MKYHNDIKEGLPGLNSGVASLQQLGGIVVLLD